MASSATRHFVLQRATAILQVPLVLWLVFSLVAHAGDNRTEFIGWVSQPLTAGLLSFFVLCVGFHMHLGMAELIEDYIHKKDTRSALSLLNVGFALVCAIGAFFAIIAITLIA